MMMLLNRLHSIFQKALSLLLNQRRIVLNFCTIELDVKQLITLLTVIAPNYVFSLRIKLTEVVAADIVEQ